MSLVVDTDVASFVFKHDTRASLYIPHLSGHILTVSFQTLAELELWTLAADWGTRRRQQLTQHLRRYVVAYPSAVLCRRWAEVMDEGRRRGQPISTADAWIAATSLLLDVPLVTHNGGDFSGISGLSVISEREIT
jgi:predicted nucleic acid-binding protein